MGMILAMISTRKREKNADEAAVVWLGYALLTLRSLHFATHPAV